MTERITGGLPAGKPLWPLASVLAGAALFVIASLRYPGGYDWAGQSISSLFQPMTQNGGTNPARWIAVFAVLFFCLGIAAVFELISRRARSQGMRKLVQVAGIGSMVYAFLVVTPMHDVMVGVALAFFLIAMLSIFYQLLRERRFRMIAAGVLCLSGTVWNAAMYFGPLESGFLPWVQKVSMLLWVVWLAVLYLRGEAANLSDEGVDTPS